MAPSIDPFVETLSELAKLDMDAMLTYDRALDIIDEEILVKNLKAFRADHERHVRDLTRLIEAYGGDAPGQLRVGERFRIEGMTAVMSHMGTHATLMTLIGNESLINILYANAVKNSLPFDVRQIVDTNRKDEERHLATLRAIVSQRYGRGIHEQEPPFPVAG